MYRDRFGSMSITSLLMVYPTIIFIINIETQIIWLAIIDESFIGKASTPVPVPYLDFCWQCNK